jgi:Uma2 family endonuclease
VSVEAKTRPVTAEELLRLPRGGQDHELIKGELRKMVPPGGEHGGIEATIAVILGGFVRRHGLGRVLTGDPGFVISRNPDTVRGPDVAFIRAGKPAAVALPKGFITEPPDLAVEVLSPTDVDAEVDAKVQEWLSAGCRMVWVVDPRRKTVAVHRPGTLTEFAADAEIDGADVVPGFKCRAGEFFA